MPAAGHIDHLEENGLRLVWSDHFANHVGEEPSAQVLYGDYGLLSSWKKFHSDATSDHRIIALAPDGRPSLQFNVAKGNVPHDHTLSDHWTPGVTHAGLAVDVWIPEDFEFSSRCSPASSSRHPGQGRWPIGLWIGGEPKKMAGGVPIPEQKGVSVRLNRGSWKDKTGQTAPFSAYVYYLNRWRPQCYLDHVRCSPKCAYPVDPLGKCYGGGLQRKSGRTPRGRWVPVEVEVKMNNEGRSNGCVTLWVDGRQVDTGCGMDLGRDRGWMIRGIYTYQMWHCDGSPKDQKWWLSNIRLYRN